MYIISVGDVTSKIGHTKRKILRIISLGNKTPSDISRELDLNPSTVSQHIQELKDIGAIEEVKNEHFRKWKYFRLNSDFDISSFAPVRDDMEVKIVRNRALIASLGIAGLIAVIAYVLFAGRGAEIPSYNLVQVAITDPPSVPQGTQALYVNYSSISIHAVINGTPEWIYTNASGTVNLMSLVNFSETIARLYVPKNSTIDEVQLNLSSAYIILNGTRYNLILRDSQITSVVSGNQSSSPALEILLDLAPTVIPMYINGVTVFVMVPQGSSVALSVNSTTGDQVGMVSSLGIVQLKSLRSVESNLSIIGASIVASNDSVNLNVSVRNNGQNSFVLRSILVLGSQELENSTGVTSIPITSVPVSSRHMGVEFLIDGNGNLSFADPGYLASSLERVDHVYRYSTSGYVLNPGQSATFIFDGDLLISNSSDIILKEGTSYKISVLGDFISGLKTNVTAG